MSLERKKFWEVWGQSNALYEDWAAWKNINSNLLMVLYELDHGDYITQKMIADYTGIPKQTVNTVIKGLLEQEYVTLTCGKNDRREKLVVLTDEGRKFGEELLAPLYDMEEKVFHIMGEERVQQMIDSIFLFNTVFEKEMKRGMK
ncbi:MAG: MarR family transcriptional regulator [Clostridia bacterium]|nr:MarR family transcriptional regulator [Clostridia bacterium]MDO5303549.1 MarR family transcriptional regulator [Clostridia bacterium]